MGGTVRLSCSHSDWCWVGGWRLPEEAVQWGAKLVSTALEAVCASVLLNYPTLTRATKRHPSSMEPPRKLSQVPPNSEHHFLLPPQRIYHQPSTVLALIFPVFPVIFSSPVSDSERFLSSHWASVAIRGGHEEWFRPAHIPNMKGLERRNNKLTELCIWNNFFPSGADT